MNTDAEFPTGVLRMRSNNALLSVPLHCRCIDQIITSSKDRKNDKGLLGRHSIPPTVVLFRLLYHNAPKVIEHITTASAQRQDDYNNESIFLTVSTPWMSWQPSGPSNGLTTIIH